VGQHLISPYRLGLARQPLKKTICLVNIFWYLAYNAIFANSTIKIAPSAVPEQMALKTKENKCKK
jgi:hypothetical protein